MRGKSAEPAGVSERESA